MFQPRNLKVTDHLVDLGANGRTVLKCNVVKWGLSVRIDSSGLELDPRLVYSSRFDPRQRQEYFSSNLYIQTSSGAHPASFPVDTGDPFFGGKARPGRDADHSLPHSAEVVNE
jgi:hypothetical protein